MSGVKAKQKFTSNQGELFQQLRLAPSSNDGAVDLDINLELLGAINSAIRSAKARGMGRDRIVDRMNQLLPDGVNVTVRQLNSWTAVSQEYKEFPARYLPAFCAACDSDLPMRALVEPIGRALVDAREIAEAELGRSLVESARLAMRQRELKKTLGDTNA